MATTQTPVIYYWDVSKKSINPLNNKDIAVLNNAQAILESISNILQTGLYTVLWSPDEGIDLDKYLFEPIDNITAMQIQQDIIYGLDLYEPRVKNVVVTVIPDIDNETFNIIINCTETITNSDQTFQVDFKKIR
jgi:phage baseplate assembly protein W